MNVKELMEQLAGMPPDAEIRITQRASFANGQIFWAPECFSGIISVLETTGANPRDREAEDRGLRVVTIFR